MSKPKLAVLVGFAVLAATMTITAHRSSPTIQIVKTEAIHAATMAPTTETSSNVRVPVSTAPKPKVAAVAPIPATTATTDAAPTENGQPCPQCTPGNGQPGGSGLINGTPIVVPDPLVTVIYPDGACGQTGQAEASRYGYQVVTSCPDISPGPVPDVYATTPTTDGHVKSAQVHA